MPDIIANTSCAAVSTLAVEWIEIFDIPFINTIPSSVSTLAVEWIEMT